MCVRTRRRVSLERLKKKCKKPQKIAEKKLARKEKRFLRETRSEMFSQPDIFCRRMTNASNCLEIYCEQTSGISERFSELCARSLDS